MLFSLRTCLTHGSVVLDCCEVECTVWAGHAKYYTLLRVAAVYWCRLYEHRGIPIAVVRHLAQQTLQALDYLHTQCEIVHLGEPSPIWQLCWLCPGFAMLGGCVCCSQPCLHTGTAFLKLPTLLASCCRHQARELCAHRGSGPSRGWGAALP